MLTPGLIRPGSIVTVEPDWLTIPLGLVRKNPIGVDPIGRFATVITSGPLSWQYTALNPSKKVGLLVTPTSFVVFWEQVVVVLTTFNKYCIV